MPATGPSGASAPRTVSRSRRRRGPGSRHEAPVAPNRLDRGQLVPPASARSSRGPLGGPERLFLSARPAPGALGVHGQGASLRAATGRAAGRRGRAAHRPRAPSSRAKPRASPRARRGSRRRGSPRGSSDWRPSPASQAASARSGGSAEAGARHRSPPVGVKASPTVPPGPATVAQSALVSTGRVRNVDEGEAEADESGVAARGPALAQDDAREVLGPAGEVLGPVPLP